MAHLKTLYGVLQDHQFDSHSRMTLKSIFYNLHSKSTTKTLAQRLCCEALLKVK